MLCLVTQSCQLCPALCNFMDCSPSGSSVHGDSSGKNTGVGCHAFLQIFPTQGLNPGLPHCGWILYHLSHQGGQRILEWAAYPFSSGSPWPRNQTGVSCIAGGFFTSWSLLDLGTSRTYKHSQSGTVLFIGDSSSVQSLSYVWLFATPWTTAPQASLSITNSRSLLKPMSIESVMLSNHLGLCRPLLLLPPIPPSVRVFSNESTLRMRWPKHWSFSFSISPSNEHPGLISFRMDWLDLLAIQGTQESSPKPRFKSINSLALSFLYSPTLTSTHDHWKNHSLD